MAFSIQQVSLNSYHIPLPLSPLATAAFLWSCPRTFAPVVSYAWVTLSSLLPLAQSNQPSHLTLSICQETLPGPSPDQTTRLKVQIITASFSVSELVKDAV